MTSFIVPGFVEDVAKDIIRIQVEKKIHAKVDSLDANFLVGKASALIREHHEEAERVKQQLEAKLPEKIASVLAEMRNLSCECRKKIEGVLRKGFEGQFTFAKATQEHLTELIREKYMETAAKLDREFRIFTGTNAIVFALLAAAAFIKRGAGSFLLPPALILLVATSLTGYLYVFNQDWLHTIIFNSYVGMSYVGYVAGIFLFLCDVLFNGAKITVEILNAMLHAIGSAIQVAPC